MKNKNEGKIDKKVSLLTEAENLTDLFERERGTVGILLTAAESESQADWEDIHGVMKDSSDRMMKMGESLDRLMELITTL